METERIADQLKRAFHGEAWSGPSVKESLEGVTAEMAFEQALPEAHSIWELVHHITAWVQFVHKRVVSGESVNVTQELNFPPVNDKSEGAWQESITKMEAAEEALRKAILDFPESRLNEIFHAQSGTSYYIQMHGAVQHSLYHAGQIILMKRFLTTMKKTPAR